MRRPLGILLALGLLAASCGSGSTSTLEIVESAATKTNAANTAEIYETVKSDGGLLAKGLTYTGGFDFGARRGRLQFDASTLGTAGASGTFDAIFDFASGLVTYIHFPQAAASLGGKSWVKLDVGALISRTTGVDLGALVQTQSSDPTSGVRLLSGATQVTKVGTEMIRGVSTTHYHVIVDVEKAANQAPPQAQDAMRKLADLYINKMLPVDAWLDSNERVRRLVVVADSSNLKLPAQSARAAAQLGKLTITIELFNFGARVDTSIPPPDQVADASQALGGPGAAAPKPTGGSVSAAKAAFVARANAICKTMNDRTGALPQPGDDPQAKANVLAQGAAITADALRQLRALPTPPGDAATVRAIFAKIDTLLSDISAEISALRGGDQARAQALETQLNNDSDAANAASNAYGLTVCGS